MSKPHVMPAPLAQQAFPFVTNAEVQKQAAAYDRSQQRRVARLLKLIGLSRISIDVIKRPIFTKVGVSFLAQIETEFSPQVEIEFVFNVEPTLKDREEDVEVFLRNAHKFVACFMDTVLEGLADMGGVDEKIDTLEWIFADYLNDKGVKKTSKSIRKKTDKFPFSFKWSCAQLGLDPDNLRDEICLALAELQRTVEARISNGEIQPIRRIAVTTAIAFINERTST